MKKKELIMKKILSLLMVALMLISICSCDSKSKKSKRDNDDDDDTDASVSTDIWGDENDDNDINSENITEITEAILRSYKTAPASDFEYEAVRDGIKITKYIGKDKIVVIPEEIDGEPVIELKSYLFANDSTVRGVFIPNTVKELANTFINNKSIEAVICEGVEVLGDNVIFNCSNLKTLILGDNLKELGSFCIALCKSLEEVYISPNVTVITGPDEIFYGCPNLTVICEEGSAIETYVKENGYKYKVK